MDGGDQTRGQGAPCFPGASGGARGRGIDASEDLVEADFDGNEERGVGYLADAGEGTIGELVDIGKIFTTGSYMYVRKRTNNIVA